MVFTLFLLFFVVWISIVSPYGMLFASSAPLSPYPRPGGRGTLYFLRLALLTGVVLR